MDCVLKRVLNIFNTRGGNVKIKKIKPDAKTRLRQSIWPKFEATIIV